MDKLASKANKLHLEIESTKVLVLDKVVEIGKLLEKKKEENPGRFYAWVKENLSFSADRASRYIRISRLKRTTHKNAKSAREIMRKESKPLTMERAIAAETKNEVQFIPIIEDRELSNKELKRLKLEYWNALEFAYGCGRRDKVLTMEFKRKTFESFLKIAKIKISE